MAQDSPQDVIVDQQNPMMRGGVFPPIGAQVIAAGATVSLYNRTIAGDRNLQYMRIQVVGTGTLKVCLNDDALTNRYNVVLAVDTGAEAGNGGVFEIFGTWNIGKVSVFSTAGTSISVVKVVTPIQSRVENF